MLLVGNNHFASLVSTQYIHPFELWGFRSYWWRYRYAWQRTKRNHIAFRVPTRSGDSQGRQTAPCAGQRYRLTTCGDQCQIRGTTSGDSPGIRITVSLTQPAAQYVAAVYGI